MATQDNKTILAAWFAGLGLTVYRGWKYRVDSSGKPVHAPPSPGELVKTMGFFGLVALANEMVADTMAHRTLALLAWGVDVAALMNLLSKKPTPIKSAGQWPPGMTPDTLLLPDGNTAQTAQNSPGAIPPGGLGSPTLPGGPQGPGLPNGTNPNQPFSPQNPGGRGGGL